MKSLSFIKILSDAESQLVKFQDTDEDAHGSVSEILTGLSAAAKTQSDFHKKNMIAREKEAASLLNKNAKLYSDLDKYNNDLDKATATLAGFDAEMKQLRTDISNAEKERAYEEAKLDDLHDKRRKAVEDSWNPLIIIDQLAFDNATKNLDKILDRISNATQRLSSLTREKTKIERSIRQLSDKVKTLERDIPKVKIRLENCQTAIAYARRNQLQCSDAALYFGTISAQLKYSSKNISDVLEKLTQLKAEAL